MSKTLLQIKTNNVPVTLCLWLLLVILTLQATHANEHAQDSSYKSSVFDRLLGGFFHNKEPEDLTESEGGKALPYDYTQKEGTDEGRLYHHAIFVIIDKRSGKRIPTKLATGQVTALDGTSLQLVRCWQRLVPGVLPDARALFLVSRHSITTGSSIEANRLWLLSRHPSLTPFDTRYEVILQECSGDLKADEPSDEQ